jgi:hypothetical protein
MMEKAEVLKRHLNLSSEDFFFIEGGAEGSKITSDVMLLRDPRSGEWSEFDSGSVTDLADAFEFGGATVLNPEGALDLILSFTPMGAATKGRIAIGPIASVLGQVGAEEWGRLTGTELSTREETFNLGRLGTTSLFGTGAASVGELIGMPFKYGRAGIAGITPESRAVQQWARQQGFPTLPTAAQTPIGRTGARQWAATSTTGRAWTEDILSRTLEKVRRKFDLKAPTEADMSTAPLQDFVDEQGRQLIDAAQAPYQGGFNSRQSIEILTRRAQEYDAVMDATEDALVPSLRKAVQDQGLVFDTTQAYDEFLRVSRGPALLGQADAEGIPTAVFPDRPEGDLAEIVADYLNLADELPVVRDTLTGTVTNPVDHLTKQYRRLRRLQGTGNPQFNSDVDKLVGALEEVILSPTVPGTTILGAPQVHPIRGRPRGERGQFIPREVPDDYRGAAQNYLDRAIQNDATRDALFLRAEVLRTAGTGQVDSLGKNLISPSHPARIAQIRKILKGSGYRHEWEKLRTGYIERMMENPHKIEAELAAWRALDPKAHRTFRNVISQQDEDMLIGLARNHRRITSGPIAQTAESMNVMTREALLALRGADPSHLRQLIEKTGGVDGDLAKVLRTEVLVDIINRSERVGHGGTTVIDAQMAAQQILDLRNSGNLGLIFPERMIGVLDKLPEYLATLPTTPGFAEGLLAAEIAQAGMQALIPVSRQALMATVKARTKVYRNRVFAGIFLNKYAAKAPTHWSLPLRTTENWLHATSVGLAAHLDEQEQAIESLIENPDVPVNEGITIPKQIGTGLEKALRILDQTGHGGLDFVLDTHEGLHEEEGE